MERKKTMINTEADIKEIRFERVDPGAGLVASIRVRGIAIPVHVARTDSGYVCVDGRRRLSACEMLCREDRKFARIPVMITNDYSKSGSGFWGNTQNHH
jgi:ParB-like chromosome segregation protein Spo0J